MEPLNTYTLKIQLEGELRRLSVTKATTLAQLHSSLQQLFQEQLPSSSSLPILTWLDEDGDVISLKTQRDLEECLAFMASSGLSFLKLQLLLSPPPPPFPTLYPPLPLSLPPSPPSIIPSLPQASEKPKRARHPTRRHGNSLPQEGLHHRGPHRPANRDRRRLQEAGERFKREPRPEKAEGRQAAKRESFEKKLEEKKSSRFFDASEHARQVQDLKDAGVALTPLDELLIAKGIIRSMKEGRRKRLFKGSPSEAQPSLPRPRRCRSRPLRRFDTINEETRRLLEDLKIGGVPARPAAERAGASSGIFF